jgi:hypothetical protein
MKAKAVSVPRDKRGLPVVMRPALPHVVELTSQTTQKRKTDTMKDYILRTHAAVEPQMTSTSQRPDTQRVLTTSVEENQLHAHTGVDPKAPTSLADISSRGSQPSSPSSCSGAVLFIGMDVHNDSIAISLALSDSPLGPVWRRNDFMSWPNGLTSQPYLPGSRVRPLATWTRWPGSLLRMVRPHGLKASHKPDS